MINHNIDLDFSTSDIKRTVVKQDSNKTHQLIIKLYDNNDEIELNANWQYTISCRKADNSFIVNSNNISISSNSICVELTKQMLSCPGTEKCELLIQNGNQTLYSSTFYIYVEKNVNYGSVLESTNEYNSLSDTLNQIKEYEKESKETKEHIQEISDDIDATYEELADAVDATNDLIEKNTVIEANEATRKTNETIRETNERKRQTDTATAIKNANDAADNANSKANDLQNKLDSHHFVLTEDKDVAGGVAGLDNNLKVSNNKLYEASTNEKGITQLDDSVTSNSSSKAATSKAVKIAYDKAVSVSQDLQTHNSSSSAHDDIRTLISNLTTRLNTLADSDDTTLDQLSEIVAYIKSNKNLIDGITTSKVNVSDIIDNLTSTATNKPLSAKQGTVLKGLITDLVSIVDDKVDKVSGKALSTNDYTTSEKNKLDGIAAGAEVNVQSDWNITNTASDAYIKNKPTSMPASDVPSWAKANNKPSYTKSEVGLGNVENKSSATIRGELTKEDVTNALGYTPPTTNTVYTHPTTSGNKHIPSGGSSGQILRWSADGTAVWGAENTEPSDSTIRLKAYANRPTSANLAAASGDRLNAVEYFLASNKMTVGKPKDDGHIIQLNWDNTGGYDSQIAIINGKDKSCLQHRGMSAGTWGNWRTVLDSSNYTDYTANYEEGTWTPTCAQGNNQVPTRYVDGKYIKIGKWCYIRATIVLASSSVINSIGGLPKIQDHSLLHPNMGITIGHLGSGTYNAQRFHFCEAGNQTFNIITKDTIQSSSNWMIEGWYLCV